MLLLRHSLLMVVGVGCLGAGSTAALAQPKPPAVTQDRWRPSWTVGDQWVIETASRPLTAREDDDAKDPKAPPADLVKVKWQFTVLKQEALGRHDCFIIEITALPDPKAQPWTRLWVDSKALVLRQLQTQIPVPGGYSTLTENYDFGKDAQPSPVVGSLTTLPIDLPLFIAGGKPAGEKQSFDYEAVSGPVGKRAPNDVGFAVKIDQTIKPVTLDDRIKGLVPQQFSKDLTVKPLAEVTLETPERKVTQIWQAGQPWPVYADNNATTARLIEVKPARQRK